MNTGKIWQADPIQWGICATEHSYIPALKSCRRAAGGLDVAKALQLPIDAVAEGVRDKDAQRAGISIGEA